MALTFTSFGKRITGEKRVIQGVSNNVNIARVRMLVSLDGLAQVYETEIEPDLGTSDTFTFEINYTLMRQIIETTFLPVSGTYDPLGLPFGLLRLQFNEIETDGTVGGNEFYSDDISGNPLAYAFNTTVRQYELPTYDESDYYMDSTGDATKKFLTAAPTAQDIKDSDNFYLTIAKHDGGGAQEVVIEAYTSGGSLLSTFIDSITDRSFNGSVVPFVFTTRFANVVPNAGYYLVYVRDVIGGTIRSETRRYNVIDSCNRFRVEWINKFGAIDYFYFRGDLRKSFGTDTKIYTKTTPINRTSEDYGNRVYDNTVSEQWVVYTDTISQAKIDWIAEMFISKNVAIIIDGNRYPVILESDSIEYYRREDGVFQIQIPLTFANDIKGIN
jgi:hypothetical protein